MRAPLSQDQLDRIGDCVQQVIADKSEHWIHLDEPDLVIDSIREMVAASLSRDRCRCGLAARRLDWRPSTGSSHMIDCRYVRSVRRFLSFSARSSRYRTLLVGNALCARSEDGVVRACRQSRNRYRAAKALPAGTPELVEHGVSSPAPEQPAAEFAALTSRTTLLSPRLKGHDSARSKRTAHRSSRWLISPFHFLPPSPDLLVCLSLFPLHDCLHQISKDNFALQAI